MQVARELRKIQLLGKIAEGAEIRQNKPLLLSTSTQHASCFQVRTARSSAGGTKAALKRLGAEHLETCWA
jgi:hypothetical protein